MDCFDFQEHSEFICSNGQSQRITGIKHEYDAFDFFAVGVPHFSIFALSTHVKNIVSKLSTGELLKIIADSWSCFLKHEGLDLGVVC